MSAPPRSFIDFTVPHREDGSPLLACSEPGDYEVYVHWLADYLHEADLPLSPLQREWLGRFQGSAEDLLFYCSDSFGDEVDWLEGIDNHITEGKSYQEFKDFVEPHWRTIIEGLSASDDPWPFEDYLGITEEGYNARKSELQQMGETSTYWSHADIPFRSLLAHAIRRIPSHDDRFRELDFYFRNFIDNSNK